MRILQSERTKPVTRVGITLDGRTLVAGGDGGFDVHDLGTGAVTSFEVPRATDVFDLALDPVGRWLYFASLGGGGCWICDLRTGERRRFGGDRHEHHVISLAASGDGSRVALSRGAGWTNRLECWAIAADNSLSLAWSVPAPAQWCMFHALAFARDGSRLVTVEDRMGGGQPGVYPTYHAIGLRDGANGECLLTLGSVPQSLQIRSGFSPDGSEVALWDDRGMHLYATDQVRPPRSRRHFGGAHFRSLAFHPSGRFIVTVANDGVARYYDHATLTQTQAFAWKAGRLQSLALSADGTLAAAGTDKGTVVLWDVDV